MSDVDYKELDAYVFAELDRERIAALAARAELTCLNEGCAHKEKHTFVCDAAWFDFTFACAEMKAA